MAKQQAKKVFISSTYSDLIEIRKSAEECITSLGFGIAEMENFGSTSKRTTLENSIHHLEQGIDYFVLLVGHRYGTVPKGSEISITHSEYHWALEKKKRKEIDDIFVFFGTDDLKVKDSQIEAPDKRESLSNFIKEIKSNNHTYAEFSDEKSLKEVLNKAFFDTDRSVRNEDSVMLFDNFQEIRNTIEESSEGKTQLVNKTLNNILNGFLPVIKLIDGDTPDDSHPIVPRIRESLEDAIPYLIFDTNHDGKVDSWGIRHVIFRVETAVKLLAAIKNPKALFAIGEDIGKTAAIDLFTKVIEQKKKLVPVSFRAFIELFDYWDSSAGWGKLNFGNQIDTDKNTGMWILITKNNFITDEEAGLSKDVIEHLYEFWKGYITGALNEGLVRLSAIYSELPPIHQKQVEFPVYRKIVKVERQVQKKKSDGDIFHVFFRKHSYGWALEQITDARRNLEQKDDSDDSREMLLTNLFLLVDGIKRSNKNRYQAALKKMSDDERKVLKLIEDSRPFDRNMPKSQYIDVVNILVQGLI